jgi:hypothetical protein
VHALTKRACSPTLLTEVILTTAAKEVDQWRDIMTVDLPSTFVRIKITDNKEKLTMKIKGGSSEMFIELVNEEYKDF